MKNLKLSTLISTLFITAGIVACSSGTTTSSSSSPTPSELGVAAFTPGTSIAESPIWVATQPSVANWIEYSSGTTAPVLAMAANASAVLVYTGGNLLLSNSVNGKFTTIASFPVPAESATIVAGSNGFVMYSNTQMSQITNSGTVTTVTSTPGTVSDITSIAYFESQFYAYNSESQVYSSPDGLTWAQASGQNIQPFTQVIQLGTNLYAAMTNYLNAPDNGNLWLGTSPTSFNPQDLVLENFFGVPAQINFMTSNGNNNLYINETVFATNRTIRLYHIASASQQNTGPLIESYAIPYSESTIKPTNVFVTPSTIYIPTGTTTQGSGNIIDPNGQTSLTATANIQAPTVITQIVGSPSQTNGVMLSNGVPLYALQGSSLLSAPDENGDLTLISSATAPATPSYQVLPTGGNTTYAALIGDTTNYILLLNNGGVLVSSGNGFVPATAITNTSNSNGTTAINAVISAASSNGSYLVQATSNGGGQNGDLYFSTNGNSWAMISQSALSGANLGILESSAAITVSNLTGLYNITTTNGSITTTYQTATPSNLSTWVLAPSPTPFIAVNGNTYALYPNSAQVGVLNGAQYSPIANALPQNYVPSGNIAVNPNTGLIALAQPATAVGEVDKITGSNYLWSASIFNNSWLSSDSWTLNTVYFNGLNGESIPSENFNINPVLLWNGKIWVSQGNGGVLQNTTNLPTSIYTSSDTINWYASGESGVTVMGVPYLF